jgi:phosphoglycolate phosphatase
MPDAARAPRRFRLVVFDWDGTLADSTGLIASCLQEACADLALPVPDAAAARHVIGLGLTDALRRVAPTLPRERYGELTARYRDRFLASDDAIALFDGVREMLDELDAAGHLLAIATGKSRAGLARALAQQRIAHRFVATRCADEGFPKPHPDMLLHLMDRTGADPVETLMIGDTTHDLELAANAGASAVAVTLGAHGGEDLARHAPLAVVESIGELRAWLRANA